MQVIVLAPTRTCMTVCAHGECLIKMSVDKEQKLLLTMCLSGESQRTSNALVYPAKSAQ